MPKPKNEKPSPESGPANGAPNSSSTALAAVGSEAAYAAFVAEARALPETDVLTLRADIQLALHNAQIGVDAVLAEKQRLSALPETRIGDIESLPQVLLAAIFADTQIDRSAPVTELPDLLARARTLRTLLLSTADSLAAAGLLPRAHVERIRTGMGKIDMARDCVELSALFSSRAKELSGKHPVSAEQVSEASEVGTALLKQLKPTRARRTSPATPEAALDRDRLWTLALRRWDGVWRAGAYLFGHAALESKVPPLLAGRLVRARRKGDEGTAAPVGP
jgi:hypothetical protein